MPAPSETMSFSKALTKDINRLVFIQEQEAKAPLRKPKKVAPPAYGTMFAKRNTRLAIREAAARNRQVIVTYLKVTDGSTVKRIVCPYSYRYRRLKTGLRKMLYAYDMDDQRIKSFVLINIQRVALSDRSFVPKWSVECAF